MAGPQGVLMPEKNLCRNPQRTLMQWNASANEGFTMGNPWLRIDRNFQQRNVEDPQKNPGSLLHFYRQLIALRQSEPALYQGDCFPVVTDGNTLAYIRRWRKASPFLEVLNLTGDPQIFQPQDKMLRGTVVLSTCKEWNHACLRAGAGLEGNEAVLFHLEEEKVCDQRFFLRHE